MLKAGKFNACYLGQHGGATRAGLGQGLTMFPLWVPIIYMDIQC